MLKHYLHNGKDSWFSKVELSRCKGIKLLYKGISSSSPGILQFSLNWNLSEGTRKRKHGSSVVSTLASGDRGPRFHPRSWRGKFRCPNTLSLVSFAGMTLD